jgi:hypothetical protein
MSSDGVVTSFTIFHRNSNTNRVLRTQTFYSLRYITVAQRPMLCQQFVHQGRSATRVLHSAKTFQAEVPFHVHVKSPKTSIVYEAVVGLMQICQMGRYFLIAALSAAEKPSTVALDQPKLPAISQRIKYRIRHVNQALQHKQASIQLHLMPARLSWSRRNFAASY